MEDVSVSWNIQMWCVFHSQRLPDDKLIGGVSAWRTEEFERVNGWSNLFWFWGGEDDDMSYRYHT